MKMTANTIGMMYVSGRYSYGVYGTSVELAPDDANPVRLFKSSNEESKVSFSRNPLMSNALVVASAGINPIGTGPLLFGIIYPGTFEVVVVVQDGAGATSSLKLEIIFTNYKLPKSLVTANFLFGCPN